MTEKKAAKTVKATKTTKDATSKKVVFKITAPDAKEVLLAGDFNGWDPAQKPLKKGAKGEWSVTVALKPGKYQYKYVIDSSWTTDGSAEIVDDGKGNMNNLKVVK